MTKSAGINRKTLDAVLKDIGEEMGWAAQNIRHEVIERGWAGREMTPESVHTIGKDDDPDHRRALYGEPASQEVSENWDNWRDVVKEGHRSDEDRRADLLQEERAGWAEAGYGKDPDPEFDDFYDPAQADAARQERLERIEKVYGESSLKQVREPDQDLER